MKQAIAAGEKLVVVKDDERAWSLLGQAYLFDKQYAKAAPFLDKYARAHSDSSGAWLNLGLAYSRSSQWKPAEEALEQAAKLDAKNVPVLLELGGKARGQPRKRFGKQADRGEAGVVQVGTHKPSVTPGT